MGEDAWTRVKRRLRAELGDDVFMSWLARLEMEEVTENCARLSVHTRCLKSWIEAHYIERVLTVLPRLHVQPRRLLPPAVLVGIALSLLNLGGRAYASHATRYYAPYAVVATAGGLLVYMYLYNQIVLWGAALTATSTRGRFIDLAGGSAPESGDSPAPDANESPGT